VTDQGLDLSVLTASEPGWIQHGPIAGATMLRASLARLLWCAIQQQSLVHIPAGWFAGRQGNLTSLSCREPTRLAERLEHLCAGNADPLLDWIGPRIEAHQHPLDLAMREEDLEIVRGFALKRVAPNNSLDRSHTNVPKTSREVSAN
jgi:hypothetical protein